MLRKKIMEGFLPCRRNSRPPIMLLILKASLPSCSICKAHCKHAAQPQECQLPNQVIRRHSRRVPPLRIQTLLHQRNSRSPRALKMAQQRHASLENLSVAGRRRLRRSSKLFGGRCQVRPPPAARGAWYGLSGLGKGGEVAGRVLPARGPRLSL